LHVGDTVLVNGEDGIPERRATVLSIDRGKVKLRFIDPVRRPPELSSQMRGVDKVLHTGSAARVRH